MYPASPALEYQLSQQWINQVVNVAAQRIGTHPRKMLAAANEFGQADAGMCRGPGAWREEAGGWW